MLFDRTKIKNMGLKNRFIRSAMHEGLADRTGGMTDQLVRIYEEIAKGGISTIITGFAFVMEGEPSSPGMLGAYDDKFIEGFEKLTDTVHQHGVNIVLQLAEGGTQAKFNAKKRTIYGPSAVEHKYTGLTPQEMTQDDIKKHVKAFGEAALRAKQGGFDAVQIHGAHGYLLSQFLTPYYNRRQDEYGGNIENRARIILETYQEIRSGVGEDFPVFIKINCSDFMGDEGLTPEESLFLCKKLDQAGIDLIEISGNVGFNPAEPEIIQQNINNDREKQCYFSQYASETAKELKTPVSVVGGNRNIAMMEEILKNSAVSYFSLARTVLCEADLVNRWEQDPDYDPKCISCNKCWSLKGNICVFNRKKPDIVVSGLKMETDG